MGMPANKLTPQQLRFADYLIEGLNPLDAYEKSYPNQSLSRKSMAVEAARNCKLTKIQNYVAEALAERRSEALLTRDQKRQILGGIAKSKRAPFGARIMAVKVDNEMTGDSAPVRIEGEITLFGIFKALAPATGLPSIGELATIKQAEVVQLPPQAKELPAVAPEKTAMERAL